MFEHTYEKYITPFVVSNDKDYFPDLKERIKDLLNEIKESESVSGVYESVSEFCKKLLNSLDLYFEGNIIDAHESVVSLLEDIIKEPGVVSDINNSKSFGANEKPSEEVQFYRARISEYVEDYNAKDMLHIPFNRRELVKTGRFSIPGLPCLYLGNSSYCCWIEMGKPAEHCFNVSPVLLDNSQKILNLTTTIWDFCSGNTKGKDNQVSTDIKLLALNIAISYKVKNNNRFFKSEYVLSQMLMLACKNKKLDGIAYFSKCVEADSFALCSAVNVALFATYDKEDISNICQHLDIGKSFNYSMFKQLLPSLASKEYGKMNLNQMKTIKSISGSGRQFPYRGTKFYEFDKYLFVNWDKSKDNWKLET